MSQKKFSKRALQGIKKAGLPEPDQGLSKAQFAKLQKQWYATLADKGFEDIEWVNHSTGTGHDSGFLKGSLISGKAYHPGRDLYYQLAMNYLTHCQGYIKRSAYDRFIWRLHTEGATYEEIVAQVKKKFKRAPSVYTLYYSIKKIAKLCYKWNATAEEGLLKKREEDAQRIEDSALAEFYNIEYNWLCNEQYAAQERSLGKQKKNSRT
jgi:hypothetical protein